LSELREQRERKHISQNELAIAVGVTQRHIAFIESGDRRPSMELAFKIAKELECSIEDIFLPEECT